MGNTNCCSVEDKNSQEVLNKKEEEERIKSVKAFYVAKHENNENQIKIIQKRIRQILAKKKFLQIINNDKRKINEYLESNELYITLKEFQALIHPIVSEKYSQLKCKSDIFEYIFKLCENRENTYGFELINNDITEVCEKLINNYSFEFNISKCLFKPIWLNKDKKIAYLGFWNYQLKPNGMGILIKTDGSRYEGNFSNGQLNGRGRYFTVKGEYFEGEFQQGIAKGKGIFINPENNIYIGDWMDDKTNGLGEERFADGSMFIGNFYKGKKNGKGKYEWTDGSSYEGDFKDDNINGQGLYIWSDNSYYQGTWKNNMMNGKGLFVFPDKTYYEGEFSMNKRSGYGKYFWNEDKYHIGGFKDGKPHGKGKYIKNGTIIEGLWHEGKLMSVKENK